MWSNFQWKQENLLGLSIISGSNRVEQSGFRTKKKSLIFSTEKLILNDNFKTFKTNCELRGG